MSLASQATPRDRPELGLSAQSRRRGILIALPVRAVSTELPSSARVIIALAGSSLAPGLDTGRGWRRSRRPFKAAH
jgi:hypothetical protein